MTMISCERVGFTYDGERFVLNNVDAHIEAGEFVCILGGNGSGKSTLAKHMNALLIPDEGTVTVHGASTSDEDEVYFIRSTAGMVFQNPDDQLVASLVEDDVAFGPENLGVPTSELAERVHDSLAQVGLMSFEKHETHALSGGQKQRVAIAGVLAMKPQVLILDEASSMLDPRGRKGLLRVCKELHNQGMTIVMITHFMEEAAEADRVIVMSEGTVAAMGTPDEILTQADTLSHLNLETPFACELSLSLQQAGMDIPTCINEQKLVKEIRARIPLDCDTVIAAPPLAHNTNTAEPLISFEDVSYTYNPPKKTKRRFFAPKHKEEAEEQAAWGNDPDAQWALEHITFDIRKGEFFGIAGHTGSGKSTLIQHMNGILQPTRGQVHVCGQDITDKDAATRIRTQVGVVFQYPEHQLFAETVFDDVAFGPRNMGLGEDEVTTRVREALELVDLDVDNLGEMSPFELSGGQQRRVAFAGVLAMKPEVLVLDEPVAGLDPLARREFLELVKKFHTQGLTIVMVSHNMDDLAQYCTRMAVLKQGTLFTTGEPHEVFLHEQKLTDIGLGVPAPQRMARMLSDAGLPLELSCLYTCESLTQSVVNLTQKA